MPTAVERFRAYPRFREKLTVKRELELNLHEQEMPKDMKMVGDALMLSEWFNKFSLQNEFALSTTHTRHTTFEEVILIYLLVLKMSTCMMQLPFWMLFSMPDPRVWLFKIWETAQKLVSAVHRRQANKNLEYAIGCTSRYDRRR